MPSLAKLAHPICTTMHPTLVFYNEIEIYLVYKYNFSREWDEINA
jgi:hypothetical protein